MNYNDYVYTNTNMNQSLFIYRNRIIMGKKCDFCGRTSRSYDGPILRLTDEQKVRQIFLRFGTSFVDNI